MLVMLSEAKHLAIASVAHKHSKNVIRAYARFLTPLGMTRGKEFDR